jgi:hypothetical protein
MKGVIYLRAGLKLQLDFFKVVRRRINRKRNSNNKGTRRAWELTRWWECA